MSEIKFKQLLQDKAQEFESFHKTCETVQAEYVAALAADYKKAFPKRKPYTPAKFKECPNRDAILKEFQPRADEIGTKHRAFEAETEKQLDILAVDTPIWIQAEKISHYSVSRWAYHTQGMGAGRYAKEDAESKAEQARGAGLDAEVRFVDGEFPEYRVFANTDEAGWDLAMRKPVQSLKDWVKSCWKRGVNPRVYNPFLPAGFEEKVGLDYFGNEVKV